MRQRPARWTAALAAAMALAAATGARATPLADGGATAEEVAAVLTARGFTAEISKDAEGDPKIRSAAQGSNFSIYFYGCDKTPRCSSIEFAVAYHVDGGIPLARINEWNRKNRFGRAYIDDVKDPYIEMDVGLGRGYSTEALAGDLDTWNEVLGGFRTFITCTTEPKSDMCSASS